MKSLLFIIYCVTLCSINYTYNQVAEARSTNPSLMISKEVAKIEASKDAKKAGSKTKVEIPTFLDDKNKKIIEEINKIRRDNDKELRRIEIQLNKNKTCPNNKNT